mmetsp:Transcript_3368/g.5338  ORF Transcript_3368/g.5338 Transcript_3368/m.5338 type:complete len:246 (-) Transcript_3368:268-1005(-)
MAALPGEEGERALDECKCYNIISTKPITSKYKVFDILDEFLQKDKERQLSPSSSLFHNNNTTTDHVREKASWNELRRLANSLIDEDPKRIPISNDWIVMNDEDNTQNNMSNQNSNSALELNTNANTTNIISTSNSSSNNNGSNNQNLSNANQILSGMVKVESATGTNINRAPVMIAGRGLDESFQDDPSFALADIEDARKEMMNEKQAKKAKKEKRKEAKKAAKKAKKKEAKKAKKHSKVKQEPP